MTRWLCIEASFLTGRYHGLRRGGKEPDWPPAPHRLFQALVAAAHLGTRAQEWSEAKAAAFRWLESREPPEIAAPPALAASSVTLSVPNNDMDVVAKAWAKGAPPPKQPSELRALKKLVPQLVAGDSTVRFLWAIGEDEWLGVREHAGVLCDESRHLHHLGLGIDLVAGNGRVLDDVAKRSLPGEIWIADCMGKATRAPVGGSLQELSERFARFLRRLEDDHVDPPTPPTRVRLVTYRRRAEGRLRPLHAFELIRENGAFASFDARKSVHVAAWLRHAAHAASQELTLDRSFIECFVCGHAETTGEKSHRLSYLSLPSVGHRHIDGRIRRALVVEPFGEGDSRTRLIMRSLSDGSLIDEAGNRVAQLRSVSDPYAETGLLDGYIGMHRLWGSVTPVVLPGLDDRRSRKAVGLVAKALAQAGYTTPVEEIGVQAEPVFSGSELARRYFTPEHLRRWPRVHTIIRFAEAIPGPVAIGSGRHSGLGILAGLTVGAHE